MSTYIHHLMKSLVKNKYVYHCRKYAYFDDIRNIFWVHQDSIKLSNTFSTMLVLDSTYRTNIYRLLLLEFVGVTSTEMTFYIAFAYMMSEKKDNVNWALEMCHDLLNFKDISPKFVVSW